MTLGELIARYRPHLADEPLGIRRSWEHMFKYTLKLYSAETDLQAFNLGELTEKLVASDLHGPVVDGYVKRWSHMIRQANEL